MTKLISLYLILFSCIFISACNHEDEFDFECPDITDNASWTSYGVFIFEKSGHDNTARRLVSDCKWHIHNNHNGGIGDTLQVASADEEVIFVWAFDEFHAFKVGKGWTGRVEPAIAIGEHITTLYAAYPAFTTDDGISHTLQQGTDINVTVISDSNGFISEIVAGFYFIQ